MPPPRPHPRCSPHRDANRPCCYTPSPPTCCPLQPQGLHPRPQLAAVRPPRHPCLDPRPGIWPLRKPLFSSPDKALRVLASHAAAGGCLGSGRGARGELPASVAGRAPRCREEAGGAAPPRPRAPRVRARPAVLPGGAAEISGRPHPPASAAPAMGLQPPGSAPNPPHPLRPLRVRRSGSPLPAPPPQPSAFGSRGRPGSFAWCALPDRRGRLAGPLPRAPPAASHPRPLCAPERGRPGRLCSPTPVQPRAGSEVRAALRSQVRS